MGQCLCGDGQCWSYVHLTNVAGGVRATTIARLMTSVIRLLSLRTPLVKLVVRRATDTRLLDTQVAVRPHQAETIVWLCSDKKVVETQPDLSFSTTHSTCNLLSQFL